MERLGVRVSDLGFSKKQIKNLCALSALKKDISVFNCRRDIPVPKKRRAFRFAKVSVGRGFSLAKTVPKKNVIASNVITSFTSCLSPREVIPFFAVSRPPKAVSLSGLLRWARFNHSTTQPFNYSTGACTLGVVG